MIDGAIDIHTHIVPEQFPAYTGRAADVPWPSMRPADGCHKHVMIHGQVYRTVADSCWSPPRRIEDMDRTHVAVQVLSPMPELLSYWLPLEDAVSMCRYLNEQIAGMIARAPDRFIGLGAVPMSDIDAAVRELDTIRTLPGFRGVEIASHVNGVSVGDPRFEPFFAAAVALDAAVFVHPLRPAGAERVVGPFTEQAVCFPGDVALAAASLITGGVAARHPRLRIAFSHGGGALAVLLPRLEHAWTITPARQSLLEAPTTTARRFYFDELVFSAATIRFLVESFGPSQILLGSDYPFALGDADPVGRVQNAGLAPAVIDAITSRNPRRFLGPSIEP